ncbi:MAG: hypothetical protein K2K70_09600 [Lachnospiraceae bacterium]|nr:hypothetical protein [Lachnospiraceae bacterium]
MNFRENYQREMNEIEKPADMTEKVLHAADREQETYADKKNGNIPKSKAIWKTVAAAIAIVCVLSLCLQHEKVISFAHSVLNGFIVSVNNEDMEFGKIKPVKMNIEAFIGDEKTEDVAGPVPSCVRYFTSYQEMNQLTQLELPCADKVEYKEIWVHIIPKHKNGYLGADFSYQGASYYMNGMFALDGFDQEDWGYGDKGNKEVYQYGNGKKACFIKDEDGTDKVYFMEGNILFQMFFRDDDDLDDDSIVYDPDTANKEQVKDLLKLFGREN